MSLIEVIRDLRELNEPVPRPRQLPTPEEVSAAERTLGVSFHPDYRQYLLEASDVVHGTLEPATVASGSGHTALIPMAQAAWAKMGLPRDLLPICEDNGDYFCITKPGEVVFWSHNGKTDEKWRDLATWIQEVWIGES
jgi:hypothetical protein